MRIGLSPAEEAQCWDWAVQRNATHARPGSQNNRISKDGDVRIHFFGLAVEYVTQRAFRSPDWIAVHPGRGHAGWDFHLLDGRSVSVKSSGVDYGRMIIPNTQKVTADLTIFGTVADCEVTIHGYATPDHYATRRYWAGDLPSPAWVMDQSALLPVPLWWSFPDYLQKALVRFRQVMVELYPLLGR